ncbi:hypothetical protein SH528x_007346 [Novipirellula sp. SH528]|uniref:hypothetical protein n=1 Tax=Novipirellula sp. SH528 TaxID=3454466 RepID=UPI003FA0CF60
MFRILAVAITIAICTTARAQSPDTDLPEKLLGFITPGMRVGIQSVDGTTNVIVHCYSEANFTVAKEIARRGQRMIDAEELAKQNELVRVALVQYAERPDFMASSADRVSVMPLIRTTLGQIAGVGYNYVLIEIDGEATQRLVISDACISKVYLDANPIRFFGPRRVESSNGE